MIETHNMARNLMHDVEITYLNKTGRNDFALLVFTKNEDANASESPYVAWRIIKAQSSATFKYSLDAAVGAYWETGGALIRAGPFSATVGSTWSIRADRPNDSPHLEPGRYNNIRMR